MTDTEDALTPDKRAVLEEADRENARAAALWHEERYPETEAPFRRALTLREAALGPDHPRVADSLYNLAGLCAPQERHAEAQDLYRRALGIRRTRLAPDAPEVADALTALAGSHFRSQQYEEAEGPYREAIEVRERRAGPDDPAVADALMALAFLLYFVGRYAEADPLLRRTLAIREAACGPDSPEVAEPLGRLAIMYHNNDEFTEDPEPLYRRALSIYEREAAGAGASDAARYDAAEWAYRLADFLHDVGRDAEAAPLYALMRERLGALPDRYRHEGDWMLRSHDTFLRENGQEQAPEAEGRRGDACERLMRAELAQRERTLGPDHPGVADTLSRLAMGASFEGEDVEAEALLRRALAIREAALGPDSPDVARTLSLLGKVVRYQGRPGEALDLLSRAAAVQQATGTDTLDYAQTLIGLAGVHADRGDAEAALAAFDRAVAEHAAPTGRDLPETLFRLGALCDRLGRPDRAEAALTRALALSGDGSGVSPLERADYLESYAAVLTGLSRPDAADAALAQAKSLWEAEGYSWEDRSRPG